MTRELTFAGGVCVLAVAALVFVVGAGSGASGGAAGVARAVASVDAAPNEVTKWNEIAQSTILAQPANASAPPAAAVFMAMVQGSVYGAVNAIDRRGRPYLVMRRADKEASKEAAVATAAFRVLDALFPAQHVTLQAHYDSSLAAIPDGPLKEAGIDGRRGRGRRHAGGGARWTSGSDSAAAPDGAGFWEPLLTPGGMPILDPSPWVALAPPFLVKSPSQFRTEGPYALTSDAYTKDFNEVKAAR